MGKEFVKTHRSPREGVGRRSPNRPPVEVGRLGAVPKTRERPPAKERSHQEVDDRLLPSAIDAEIRARRPGLSRPIGKGVQSRPATENQRDVTTLALRTGDRARVGISRSPHASLGLERHRTQGTPILIADVSAGATHHVEAVVSAALMAGDGLGGLQRSRYPCRGRVLSIPRASTVDGESVAKPQGELRRSSAMSKSSSNSGVSVSKCRPQAVSNSVARLTISDQTSGPGAKGSGRASRTYSSTP